MWVPTWWGRKGNWSPPLTMLCKWWPFSKGWKSLQLQKEPCWGSRDSSVSLTHFSQSPRSWIWSRHVLLSARDLTLGHWSPVGVSLPQFLKGPRPAFPWIWGWATENKNGTVVKIMWQMISYVSLAPWRSLDPPSSTVRKGFIHSAWHLLSTCSESMLSHLVKDSAQLLRMLFPLVIGYE